MAAPTKQTLMTVVPGRDGTPSKESNIQEKRLSEVPSQQSQMFWLYEMIGSHGHKPVFGPFARTWLKQRYCMADVSSRLVRKDDTWWEDTVNQEVDASMREFDPGVALKTGEGEQPGEAGETTHGEDKEKEAKRLSTKDKPKIHITLEEVMKDQRLRAEFYDFCEENYQQQHLDFLEQVDLWKSKCFGQEAKKGAGDFDIKEYLAKNIFETYIDEGSENPISLPQEERADIENAVTANSKKLVLPLFDKACVAVHKYLREEMLPAFSESEELRDILAVKSQEHAEKQPSEASKAVLETSPDGELVCVMPESEQRPQGFEGTPEDIGAEDEFILLTKAKPWFNSPGYRSLSVTILDSKEPQPKKRYNAHLSVDSKTVTTPQIKMTMPGADWNLTVTLPLLNTTQWLIIQLYSEKVLLGTGTFQIADILAWMEDESADGQKYRKEGKWFPMDFKPKGSQVELQLRIQASTVPLSDAQMEALEKMQVLPESFAKRGVSNKIRGKVSKKKLRFKDDGYDLDLTYITPRLLAMGYPSEGVEGAYRNSMRDVQSFFARRHPQAYRLYNLCSERKYDPSKFQNSVVRFPFDDHNPPPFDMMPQYCEDLRRWLTEHPQHVAAIHCKAGKGRTGTMIAAYLLYVGHSTTAQAALDFFAERRTKNSKGVTIPSQARFVKYFAHYCKLKRLGKPAPGRTTLFLSKIVMHGIPKAVSGEFFFILKQNGGACPRNTYDSNKLVPASVDKTNKKVVWDLSKLIIPVEENFLVVFKAKKPITGQQEKFAQAWLNTRWEDLDKDAEDQDPYMMIPKAQLDKVVKDKKHKLFDENFAIQIFFSETAMSGRIKTQELAGNFVFKSPFTAHAIPTPAVAHARKKSS